MTTGRHSADMGRGDLDADLAREVESVRRLAGESAAAFEPSEVEVAKARSGLDAMLAGEHGWRAAVRSLSTPQRLALLLVVGALSVAIVALALPRFDLGV